jgi:hypothetical protein
MIPTTRVWLNLLQFGLLMSTAGWGISFYFTFVSWDAAAHQLQVMGAEAIQYQPLLDYWLRMASVVFGCIGLGSFLACARPHHFLGFIQFLGPFHWVVGTTLAVAAYRNHLTPKQHHTFIADITFCFLTGTLILAPLIHAWCENRRLARKQLEG